ncbi:MAG: copper chaperone PCu(A)C [Oceanicaulis sp.]|nr:copper chaperone PCu(A)C [Oceanicaulis sp.]
MNHAIWLAAASAFALAACNDPATPTPYGDSDETGASTQDVQDSMDQTPADQAPAAASDPTAYTVVGAWIRNPPPGRDVTAAFMTLTAGNAEGRLIDARTNAAARTEIHTMAMEDDVMRMRRVEGFDIPEGGSITLAPGGDHLMLFEIDRDVLATGQVLIELVFENGQTVNQVFEVRDTAPDAEGN